MSGYTYSLVGGSSLPAMMKQSSSSLRAMRLSVPADAFCFGAGYQCMERSNMPPSLMVPERSSDQLIMTSARHSVVSGKNPCMSGSRP